jgi:hypothetical protein
MYLNSVARMLLHSACMSVIESLQLGNSKLKSSRLILISLVNLHVKIRVYSHIGVLNEEHLFYYSLSHICF